MLGWTGNLVGTIIQRLAKSDFKPIIRIMANVSFVLGLVGVAGWVFLGLVTELARRTDDLGHWTVYISDRLSWQPWVCIVLMVPGIVFIILRELGITPWVGWR